MCSVSLALTVGSTLFGAYAQNQQAKEQARFQEAAARYNMVESKNRAIDIRNKAIQDENEHRRKVAQMLAGQQVALAANNVDIGMGSAALLQSDTKMMGEIDAIQIRNNALLNADAVMRQGEYNYATDMYQANQTRTVGSNAMTGGLLTAGGQIVSSKWYRDNYAPKPKTKRYDIHSSASLNEQRLAT